jgi:hypothetical protein
MDKNTRWALITMAIVVIIFVLFGIFIVSKSLNPILNGNTPTQENKNLATQPSTARD